jgi:hypothetical protein
MGYHPDALGDHVHPIHWDENAHQFEGVTDFDFDTVCRNVDGEETEERMISMSDASAAISILLGWICQSSKHHQINMSGVGARAESLLLLLDPNQSKFKSLAEIASAANLTRAALSKSLLSLKDQSGLSISVGKLSGSRDTYRAVQNDLVAQGKHASEKRRKQAA